jgi:EF-hand domain pair
MVVVAGVISATELTELMENLGHKMTYAKLTKIMSDFDKDHNGSIEFWEFMRMFRNQLLDLQEILDYIKMNPVHTTATEAPPAEVSLPPPPFSPGGFAPQGCCGPTS